MFLTGLTAWAVATAVVGGASAQSTEVEVQPVSPETRSADDERGDAEDDEATDEGRRTDGDDRAGEGKLSDRVKSVQRKVFLKRHRFEFYPHFGIDLNDAFYAHLVLGGSVGYHIVDSLALEGRFGYVLESVEEEPVRFLRQSAGALPARPPRFELHGELDAIWAPLYGKISLFGESILHFDTYLAVGGGVFKTDEGVSPAINFGLGQRYFVNDWLVVRVELRDYIFPDTRDRESDLQNLLMVNVSVSAFLPTSFEYENP